VGDHRAEFRVTDTLGFFQNDLIEVTSAGGVDQLASQARNQGALLVSFCRSHGEQEVVKFHIDSPVVAIGSIPKKAKSRLSN
jgi:hypothetical protein